ncbi:hypothetical protein BDR03DRAFT_1003792 [Suillus americanus]|nr:hypothetical protein BDR03DRAFT_1003792 [Suillus americanus]
MGAPVHPALLCKGRDTLDMIRIHPQIPNDDDASRWMTPEERALAISRLVEDGYSESDEKTTMQGVRDAVSDWKSSISIRKSNLTEIRYSDKKQKRYRSFVISNALGVLAFIISISTITKAARYISLFLMAQVFIGYVILLVWISNTFAREPVKRAVAIALMNAVGQIGTIVGSYASQLKWGPTYRYSYVVCIAALRVSTGMFGGMYWYLKRLNEQIERNEWDAKDVNEIREISFKYLV